MSAASGGAAAAAAARGRAVSPRAIPPSDMSTITSTSNSAAYSPRACLDAGRDHQAQPEEGQETEAQGEEEALGPEGSDDDTHLLHRDSSSDDPILIENTDSD